MMCALGRTLLICAIILDLGVDHVLAAPLVTEPFSCCTPDLTCNFIRYENRRIRDSAVHAVIPTTAGLEECVMTCIQYTAFTCLSASYSLTTSECGLSRNNLQSSGTSLTSDTEWNYFNMDRGSCGPVNCSSLQINNGNVAPAGEVSYNSTVAVTCQTGYELNGQPSLTCIDADTWNYPTPTCDTITCSSIPTFSDMTANSGGPVDYSQSVTYTCSPGYYKSTSEDVVCSVNGIFTVNRAPVCSPITCDPYTSANGGIAAAAPSYYVGDTVTFTCEPGYELSGSPEVICSGNTQPGTWSPVNGGGLPTCGLVNCDGDVTAVSNSQITSTGSYLVGDALTYQCNPGYQLIGSPALICLQDRTFDLPPPTCDALECPNPDGLYPDVVISSTGPYYYQDRVTATCNDGYTLSTPSTLVCGSDGTWIGTQPVCTQVFCEDPVIPDGAADPAGPYPHLSTVTIACDPTYEMVAGDSQLTCDADRGGSIGVWVGDLPTCQQIQCTVPIVQDATVSPASGPYFYSDLITFTCTIGYTVISGSTQLRCESDSSWDQIPPVCSRTPCPDITMDPGVEGFLGGYVYEDTPALYCSVGNHESAPSTLICEAGGTWGGSPLLCVETECPAPSIASSSLNPSAPYYHTDTVTVVCDDGYRLENSNGQLVCDASTNPGSWSGSIPQCTRIECPSIDVAAATASPNGPYFFTDTVTYTCITGYNMTGSSVLTCQADSSYSHPAPRCVLNSCPNIQIEPGIDGFSGGYVYNDVPNLSCALGYHIIQASTLRCDEWGRWIGEPPICRQTECAAPTVAYSTLSPPAPYHNADKVFVTCDYGYKLESGSATLSCDASATPGVWIGNIPLCTLIVCVARDISYGSYSGFPHSNFGFNDKIEYTCDMGHELIGAKSLICQSSELWASSEPYCQPYRCVSEEVQDGTISSVGPYLWTDVISYICDVGFNITGESRRTCGATGDWESPAPECIPNQCALKSKALTALQEGPYLYGDRVDVACSDRTRYLDGWEFLVCDQWGAWDRELPTCKEYECEEPVLRNGTKLTANKSPYYIDEKIQFQCAHDMKIQGTSTLTCVLPESGQIGKWDGEPPTCTALAANAFAKFEAKDKWLNWFLPALAAALLAAAIAACCCWFFCCGARRRRKRKEHDEDCDCEKCQYRPDTPPVPVKHEPETVAIAPVAAVSHIRCGVTATCCQANVCNQGQHTHGSCCQPPPSYSTCKRESVHTVTGGCAGNCLHSHAQVPVAMPHGHTAIHGISEGFYSNTGFMAPQVAYNLMQTLPSKLPNRMMNRCPSCALTVDVSRLTQSNKKCNCSRCLLARQLQAQTIHPKNCACDCCLTHMLHSMGHECPKNLSSQDSGFHPDGHCMHGIPSGACKICIPPPKVGGVIMVRQAEQPKQTPRRQSKIPTTLNEKCVHGLNYDVCGDCGKCPHGNARKGLCGLCKKGLCPHGKSKDDCSFCSPKICSHGKPVITCKSCRDVSMGEIREKGKSDAGDINSERRFRSFAKSRDKAKSMSDLTAGLNAAPRVPAAAKKLKLPGKAAWMPHTNTVRDDANHKYTSTK